MQSKLIPNPKITLNCTMCWHHVHFVYKHDKHGFRRVRSETEKMFSGFVVSICIIYGLKLIVIWVIDVKLVDRQFPAFQNQDDRQAGIFGRHLPAVGRQIRALSIKIKLRILNDNSQMKVSIKIKLRILNEKLQMEV